MRVLICGLGSIGQRHVRNLRTLLGDEVEILAYRVRGLPLVIPANLENPEHLENPENPESVEARYNIRSFTDLDTALAASPEVVFVTNPNTLHIPVAMAAAEAGCHLFIEKPLSHTLDGVDELAETVERRHLVCLVGYHLRFHPALTFARSCLDRRAIGRLLAARLEFGEYLPGWHPYEDYRQMHASRRDLGGGVILSQIHDLDYAYALFGLPRRVFAIGGHWSHLDVDVEDTASILMDCSADGRAFPVHAQQDYLRKPKSRTCEVTGDAGVLRLNFNAGTVDVFDAHGGVVEARVFPCERNDLFLDELRHFLSCLRGESRPVVCIREAIQSLRMALAARESIDSGQVVTL